MNRTTRFALVGFAALGVVATSLTVARMSPAEPPEFELPPGWTMDDVMTFMEAATPGPMHAHLAKGIGKWTGKTTMWHFPGAEPVTSESQSTITPMLDGRFIKVEVTGEVPDMGPFNGFGIYGYDNVAKQFQAVWVDSMGTGMAVGTGELSSDGKTMTWNYAYNCPMTKKPTTLREIERFTSENTSTLEMYGTCPKTAKEFKMMEIELTRKGASKPIGLAR